MLSDIERKARAVQAQKRYAAKNPEKIATREAAKRAKNADAIKAYSSRYYRENASRLAERRSERAAEIAAYAASYRLAHKEEIRAKARKPPVVLVPASAEEIALRKMRASEAPQRVLCGKQGLLFKGQCNALPAKQRENSLPN